MEEKTVEEEKEEEFTLWTVDEILTYEFPNYKEEFFRIQSLLHETQKMLVNSEYNVKYTILPLVKNLDAWLITFNLNRNAYQKRLQGSLRVRICQVEKAMELSLKLNFEIKKALREITDRVTYLENKQVVLEAKDKDESGKRALAVQEELENLNVELRQLHTLENALIELKRNLFYPFDYISVFYNWFALLIDVIPPSYKSLNSNLRLESLVKLKN